MAIDSVVDIFSSRPKVMTDWLTHLKAKSPPVNTGLFKLPPFLFYFSCRLVAFTFYPENSVAFYPPMEASMCQITQWLHLLYLIN